MNKLNKCKRIDKCPVKKEFWIIYVDNLPQMRYRNTPHSLSLSSKEHSIEIEKKKKINFTMGKPTNTPSAQMIKANLNLEIPF